MSLSTSAREPVLRIALVTELSGEADEGMRVWIRNFVDAVAAAGHDVTDLRLEGSERTAAFDPRQLRRLRALRPDVVQYVPFSGLTTASLARLRMLAVASRARHASIAVLQADPDRLSSLPGLRPASALFASARLEGSTGRIATNQSVVYPIVDVQRFADAHGDRIPGWPAGPVVLHVGHLKRSRNLDVLETIARRGRASVVMIASTSTEPDPEVWQSLEASGVTVMRRYFANIESAYAQASVYVFPVEEQLGAIELPLSVVEARAAGTPVVSTPFGALPEIFDPGPALRFTEAASIPDVVEQLLSSPRVPISADEARHFSRDRFVRAVEDAYKPAPTRCLLLSGIDGAGKSTQVARLEMGLAAQGLKVATIWGRWDPLLAKPAVKLLELVSQTGTKSDRSAESAPKRQGLRRRLLDRPVVNRIWRLLMVVDYGARLAPRVRAALRTHDVVLLDRYWPDVMVDYSYGGELRPLPGVLMKMLPPFGPMVILDVDPETAIERSPDIPDLEYLVERRRLYHRLAEEVGAEIIDANGSADKVETSVRSAFKLPEARRSKRDG